MTTRIARSRNVAANTVLPMAKLKKIVVDGWRSTLVDPVRTQKLNQLVRGFSEQVAIVDEDWTIVAVNDAWKQMVKVAGYPELSPGTDYRLFLKTFAEKGHANAIAVLRGVNAIDHGESDFFQLNYAGVDEWQGRMLQFRINRVHVDGCALATITRYDITDTIELKRLREDFSSSIIQCQAEERGRMARELHDSTTQLLTSVGLLLRTLQHEPLSPEAPGLIEEMQGFLSQAQQEIRSISYLAHAPAIHEMGFLRAVEALSQGYGRRAQLDVTFEVHGTPTPLSSTAENALYRVAQEALSNIHRHAQATHVRIAVAFRKSVTHFVIIDNGIGISHEIFGGRGAAGVGLTGMRLRLSEIGGRLSVCRLSPGTAVIASIQS